jgi:low affinity Fe/Cu permease
MVFLIQNTQNRDARAINLKLNELIRSIDKARDQMIDIENLSDLNSMNFTRNTKRSRGNAMSDKVELVPARWPMSTTEGLL